MAPHDLLVRSGETLWRAGFDYLVLGRADGSLAELGGSAALVWSALAEPILYIDLIDVLADLTGNQNSTIETEISGLLDWLIDEGHVDRLP